MSNQKVRAPRYVTLPGAAIFPYLITPDTKFNVDGVFQTELRLSAGAILNNAKGQSVGDFQEFLDTENSAVYEKAVAEYRGKKDKKGKPIVITEADAPYRLDPDNGDLIVKFKLNATGKTRDGKTFTQAPALFDAKGKPFTQEAIWGGSVIKVSFEVVPYVMESTKTAGISLRMKAVQVIELRSGGGASAENYGFGEEEGYENEETDAEQNGFGGEDTDGYEDLANRTNGGDF